jgi:tRNA pseudouridine38-40 synthase
MLFHGFQRQKNTRNTVQEKIEVALFELTQEVLAVVCAGRTDTGVHAMGQVVHVDFPGSWQAGVTARRHPREGEDPFTLFNKNLDQSDGKAIDPRLREDDGRRLPWQADRLRAGLNFYLKNTGISVLKVYPCNLHARFDAKERFYEYHILNRAVPSPLLANRAWHVPKSLDVGIMAEACHALIGYHNFDGFRSSACTAPNPIRTLNTASVTDHHCFREADGLKIIKLNFSAQAFLHNQVRIMVGTIIQIGLGKLDVACIVRALQTGSRKDAGITAPPHGLYFVKVLY